MLSKETCQIKKERKKERKEGRKEEKRYRVVVNEFGR